MLPLSYPLQSMKQAHREREVTCEQLEVLRCCLQLHYIILLLCILPFFLVVPDVLRFCSSGGTKEQDMHSTCFMISAKSGREVKIIRCMCSARMSLWDLKNRLHSKAFLTLSQLCSLVKNIIPKNPCCLNMKKASQRAPFIHKYLLFLNTA